MSASDNRFQGTDDDLDMECPKCGEVCARDSVHNGVGVLYGPWGCGNCKWSESPDYDFSDGKKPTHPGGTLDQFGGLTPFQ